MLKMEELEIYINTIRESFGSLNNSPSAMIDEVMRRKQFLADFKAENCPCEMETPDI